MYHITTVNKENTRMSRPPFLEPPLEFEIGPKVAAAGSVVKKNRFKDYAHCKLNKHPQ